MEGAMPTINRKMVMGRAWSLLRQSMALRFDRATFADCLRRAWAEAKDAPVTAYAILQRRASVPLGAGRADVIHRLELALAAARARAALYRGAGAAATWSAAKHRSADFMRVANLESLIAAERSAA